MNKGIQACLGKEQFSPYEKVRMTALKLIPKGKSFYKCPCCAGWHLTSKRSKRGR